LLASDEKFDAKANPVWPVRGEICQKCAAISHKGSHARGYDFASLEQSKLCPLEMSTDQLPTNKNINI
jgi:hypothetical protein